jgi:NADH-quinone oxidoreductase subunit L
LYAIAVFTAGLTAYYMFRMIFLTFFGPDRMEHAHVEHHGRVPAWLMQAPVALLMIPTIGAGYLILGGSASPWAHFFAPLFPEAGVAHARVPIGETLSTILVLGVVAVGIFCAYLRYGTALAQRESVERVRAESKAMPGMLARALYVDDLINVLFIKPTIFLGRLAGRYVDPIVLDGIVRDVAILATWLGREVRLLQNGFVRSYAFVIVVGAVLFVAYFASSGVSR